jgi:hypothetical protein
MSVDRRASSALLASVLLASFLLASVGAGIGAGACAVHGDRASCRVACAARAAHSESMPSCHAASAHRESVQPETGCRMSAACAPLDLGVAALLKAVLPAPLLLPAPVESAAPDTVRREPTGSLPECDDPPPRPAVSTV